MTSVNTQPAVERRNNISVRERFGVPVRTQQNKVNEYFTSEASYWDTIYRDKGLHGKIYQRRQQEALRLLDGLGLPAGARILEIGCGAGYMTVALAKRGFTVEAIDATVAMLQTVNRNVVAAGVGSNVRVHLGDTHRLEFSDDEFDVVVALGVLPWLYAPALALKEMQRTLKPGGYLVFSADNQKRLNHLLDPRISPVMVPFKEWCKRALERRGMWRRQFRPTLPVMHTHREVKDLLRPLQIEVVETRTVGFGPFTFLGKRFLPDGAGRQVHRLLQKAADRRMPFLRYAGSHFVILGCKIRCHVQDAVSGDAFTKAEEILS